MAERTLENRYRVLAAGFGDSPDGQRWRSRLGDAYTHILEALTLNFSVDLAIIPRDLDQEHVSLLLKDLFPARLGDSPPVAEDLPDLVLEFLLFIGIEEGIPKEWEFRHAIDQARADYDCSVADPNRSRLAGPKAEPHRRPADKIGRNDPCPCGSGKKYKKCCANK
ncbi:MAG: hypothetical protein ACI97A_000431 [Planctomycetota bacterium]|jgi:hypothetical protein